VRGENVPNNDSSGWEEEGGGFRLFQSDNVHIPNSRDLYSRETLSKYGDTLAKFGYQGFSNEENYKEKYGVVEEEEESPYASPTKLSKPRTPTTHQNTSAGSRRSSVQQQLRQQSFGFTGDSVSSEKKKKSKQGECHRAGAMGRTL